MRPVSSSSKSLPSGGVNTLPPYLAIPDYYQYVARGYDMMAESYDQVEGRNAISERVRRTTLSVAIRQFRSGDRILELGCGTGRDAVALAKQGVNVVATDVSPEMVSATRHRAEREGIAGNVTAIATTAANAAAAGGPYDGVYSNGAVLNLEPDLARVARGLGQTVRPGGLAVLTFANRVSLFELLLYPLVLRPRKAFRKLGASVPIPISREGVGRSYVVPTRFLTPGEFYSVFKDWYDIQTLRGLQAITPPWNLVDIAKLFEGVVAPLERVEDAIGTRRGIRSLGAICLFVLKRRQE